MPTVLRYPLINGHRYDYSSLELDIAGLKVLNGLRAVNYKHTLDPGEVRGNRAQALGRTRGKYSAEGSIEIFRLEYDVLLAELARQGALRGQGYLEVSFDITAVYAEASASALTKDKLSGCRLKTADHGYSEGNDPLLVKCDLSIMYIEENGLQPIGTQFLR